MKFCSSILALSISVILVISCQQKSDVKVPTKLNQYKNFVSEMNSRGFTTGNILVYENGKIIFKSSDGLRTINPIDSLTLNSQFRLASVSKQFTGMAIMKLKEAGKLDYNQKVNTILLDFPYDTITVKHLLHHISGLADYEAVIEEHFVKDDPSKAYILGNNEILDVFYEVNPKLNFQPGENWEYSNTGYLVLASIVEQVSGLHFREFLKEQIFDPIGMTNTVLYDYQIEPDSKMPNRVFGYYRTLNQKDFAFNDYNIVNDVRGDGGIYSTLDDLYKWNMALANYTIIPKSYLDEAWSYGALNNGKPTRYGFGWKFPKDKSLPKTVFHAGGWVGFGTFLYNEVETKSGYIVLTNDSSDTFINITDAIDSIRVGKSYVLPKMSIVEGMAKRIFSDDLDTALKFYNDKKLDSVNYAVGESDLNQLGYLLLQNTNIEESLAIFKLNIKEHPNSANTYDSYGDALLAKGDSIEALNNFNRAFKMDSTYNYTKSKIVKLEKVLKTK